MPTQTPETRKPARGETPAQRKRTLGGRWPACVEGAMWSKRGEDRGPRGHISHKGGAVGRRAKLPQRLSLTEELTDRAIGGRVVAGRGFVPGLNRASVLRLFAATVLGTVRIAHAVVAARQTVQRLPQHGHSGE